MSNEMYELYLNLLKYHQHPVMRSHMQRTPDEICIGVIDLEYGMDGFTLTLRPVNEQ